MTSIYSVFYELDNVFDICRTDFSSIEAANFWTDNKLLSSDKATFYFILKDGHIHIKGDFLDDDPEFFNDCMKFSKVINVDQVWNAFLNLSSVT